MLIHLNTAAGEQLREHWDSRPWNAPPRPGFLDELKRNLAVPGQSFTDSSSKSK